MRYYYITSDLLNLIQIFVQMLQNNEEHKNVNMFILIEHIIEGFYQEFQKQECECCGRFVQ